MEMNNSDLDAGIYDYPGKDIWTFAGSKMTLSLQGIKCHLAGLDLGQFISQLIISP